MFQNGLDKKDAIFVIVTTLIILVNNQVFIVVTDEFTVSK